MIKYRSHIISACALVSFGPTLACLLDITLAKNTNMKNSDALKTLLSATKITQYYLLTALVKYYSPEHAPCKKKVQKKQNDSGKAFAACRIMNLTSSSSSTHLTLARGW